MNPKTSTRLDSIDALRGFDMFFITGGAALIHALYKACPASPLLGALDAQMHHMPWNGFTCYDMIFPLFLFLAGVSFPFSLAKSRERGVSERRIVVQIVRRAVTLFLLGLVFNGFFRFDFASMRWVSVLGRIGLAWGIAALCYRRCRWQTIAALSVGVLAVYGCATALLIAPDAPAGAAPLSVEGNIVGYVDRMLLPGRLLDGRFDPLGLLSTLPAVVTAWLGMFVGTWIRNMQVAPLRRLLGLVAGGAALTLVGLLLDPVLPINKPLWSSSYVCFAGGISALLFALFYGVIDLLGWRRWAFYFRMIGLNSITIYLVQKFVDMK